MSNTTTQEANRESGVTSERSWLDFLSERDKKFLAIGEWAKQEPFGLGENPAVLVLDVYYAAVGTERLPFFESIKTWPRSCGEEAWDAIDVTASLLEIARARGIPVIYAKDVAREVSGIPHWTPRKPRPPAVELPAELSRRSLDIVDEVAPEPGELVIEKSAPSAFQGTPLTFWMNANRIDTLIVCGESTSGCVRATVADAATSRYRVGVVADACFDRLQASHWIALFEMDQKYADVIDSSEAKTYLESVTPGSN